VVSNSGAKAGTARLRPLNLPRPIEMIAHPPASAGTPGSLPAVLIDQERRLRVTHIQDTWDIDEEWWRDRLNRRYYHLVLEDGSLITVYQNLVDGAWYQQNY
jgi:hypothetical protein